MNIFAKYTFKSLAKNKMRTFVTIIGIVLSVALSTAVVEGANSAVDFLRRAVITQSGDWEIYETGISEKRIDELKSEKYIKDYISFDTVGWGEIGSKNEDKPYLLVKSADERIKDAFAIKLKSGRFPENSSEIILPEHLEYNGEVSFKLGDVLTVSLGDRESEGYRLYENTEYLNNAEDPDEGTESIVDAKEKSYTVVGFYPRLSYRIEPFGCPGYTAITVDEEDVLYNNAVLRTTNPGKVYDYLEESGRVEAPYYSDVNLSVNNDLVKLYGGFANNSIKQLLYSFVTVLLIIIAFGSISLIYNSFSISVGERTKQFGVLKSIGATKKQIRSAVFNEAIMLSIIAIPIGLVVGCVGIGVTLTCLKDEFAAMFGSLTSADGVEMRLAINGGGLLIVCVICLITTLISAYIPARRAMKLNPIEAVRQNSDIKVSRRAVKSSWFAKKFFGFEGMMASKNFRRSKKKYRATVISLFVSIVLFISASSFCAYLSSSLSAVSGNSNGSDVSMWSYDDFDKITGDIEEIKNFKNLDEVMITYSVYNTVQNRIDNKMFSKEYWDYLRENCYDEQLNREYSDFYQENLVFVDRASFDKICEENGIDASEYHNVSDPKGLIYNKTSEYIVNPETHTGKWIVMDLLDPDRDDLSFYGLFIKKVEGYEYFGYSENVDTGSLILKFIKSGCEEGARDIFNNDNDEEYIKKGIIKKYPAEEICDKVDFNIGAIIKKQPKFMGTGYNPTVYFSEEMIEAIYHISEEKYVGIGDRQTYLLLAGKNAHALFDEAQNYADTISSNYWDSFNEAEEKEIARALAKTINVFSYGFIILISLIALANVFNSIATNISLRKREFAMLKTVGLSEKSFRKMMSYECVIYGVKSLMYGLPVAILATFGIYKSVNEIVDRGFYIPWYSLVISIGSVFVVVFATMIYATKKARKENLVESLKSEIL